MFSTSKKLFALFLGLSLAACAHNPNKAEKIDTSIDKSQQVSGDTKLGVKDGNMVVQRKVRMSDELKGLQREVYELEDHVYGNAQYGSLGLYGVLKDCRTQLVDKANGGDGHLVWTEPMDRVTDKEEELKLGLDEKDQLVGVSEEMLRDRLERFKGYKELLSKRQTEYDEKVAICKNDLKTHKETAQQ
jgi:hypothetical protein